MTRGKQRSRLLANRELISRFCRAMTPRSRSAKQREDEEPTSVLDFVGTDGTLALGAAAARMLGDLTLIGIAGGSLSVSFFSVPYELSVQSTYWGSRSELVEVLDLDARGLLRPKITTFGLDQAMEAYRHMEEGTADGRAVIVPNPT